MVTSTKFLGIWLDSNLKWQTHFAKLTTTVIKNTQLLRMCKNQFNVATKRNIYFAHIYSHLSYGCTTWGNMLNKSQIRKLTKLQNRCIEQITNRKLAKNDYQSLKILKVPEIITLQNAKLGHRVQHKNLPIRLLQSCQTNASKKSLEKCHSYNTRFKKEQNRPLAKSKWYQDCFLTKQVQDFQKLPVELRKIENLKYFALKCKAHLLSSYHSPNH